jgi:hypothetical protein
MTSFAFIFGVLPLVNASGAGAEMRQSLGTAVFAGMIGVTIFGLLFTPTFYVVVRGISGWLRRPKQDNASGDGGSSASVEAQGKAEPGVVVPAGQTSA